MHHNAKSGGSRRDKAAMANGDGFKAFIRNSAAKRSTAQGNFTPRIPDTASIENTQVPLDRQASCLTREGLHPPWLARVTRGIAA